MGPASFRTTSTSTAVENGQYYSGSIRKMFTVARSPTRHSNTNVDTSVSFYPTMRSSAEIESGKNKKEGLEDRVPFGWPHMLVGPLAWEAHQMRNEAEFIYDLNSTEIKEVNSALQFFDDTKLPLDKVTKNTFPLPSLGIVLSRIQNQVYAGRGFAVVRGLQIDSYDARERAVVFLGISSYIAEERGAQDRFGTMIKHIMDDEKLESISDLPFHTDVTCDVVGLMTVEASDRGGMSTIASACTVYNDIAQNRPDLLHVLTKPDWPFDTFGRDPAFYHRAPLYYHDCRVIFNFSRRLLAGHPVFGRSEGVPKLSRIQAEALDAIHHAAEKHHLKVSMQKGDIRFINNMGLLHGREGFNDDTEQESKRHLMRLWLRNSKLQWSLPPELRLVWGRIFDDKERSVQWLTEPYIDQGKWIGRGLRSECD